MTIEAIEKDLFRLEMEILKSKRFHGMIKKFDIGVKRKKQPKLRPINLIAMSFNKLTEVTTLAQIFKDRIDINLNFIGFMGPSLTKKILTHELVHGYLIDNGILNHTDGDELFESMLKYMRLDIDFEIMFIQRKCGTKDWKVMR